MNEDEEKALKERGLINADPDSVDDRLRDVLRHIGEFVQTDRAFIFFFTEDGRFLEVNFDWARQGLPLFKDDFIGQPSETFAWTLEQFRRLGIADVTKVEDLPEGVWEREFCMSHGIRSFLMVPFFLETKLAGGVGVTVETSEKTWTDRDASILRLVGDVFADSLTRKRTASDLQMANQRLKAIIDASPLAILALDEEEKVVMWSPAAERLFGWKASEALGRPLPFVPAGKEEESVGYRRRAFQGESLAGLEIVRVRKDGTPIDVRLFTAPLHDAEGKTTGIVGIHEDITDLKQAEKALKESEKKARTLALENAFLAEIGRIIGSSLDIQEVYQGFAERLHELLPYERVAIGLNNLQDRTISELCVAGTVIGTICTGSVIPFEDSINEQLIKRRSGMIIPLENEDQVLRDFPPALDNFQAGMRSSLSAPLISRNEVIGGLHIQSVRPAAYTEENLRIAEAVALQISGAIANARLYSEHLQMAEQLRQSEERYRSVVEFAPVGIAVGQGERYILVNPKMVEMSGYSKRELTSQPFINFVYQDDRDMVREHYSKRKKGEPVPWTFRARLAHKDGGARWWRIFVNPFSPGDLSSWLAFFIDITDAVEKEEALEKYRSHLENLVEQRTAGLATLNKQLQDEINLHLRTKDSLSQSEQRYREIVETAQEGIWITDGSGRTTYVNRRVADMLERPGTEILGRPTTDFLAPEAHPMWSQLFERCRAGIKERTDFKFRTKRDRALWAIVASSCRLDERGQFAGVLLMVTDITDRKELEEKIIRSKKMLQAIFDGISEPLILVDKTFAVKMLNRASMDYYGFKAFPDIIGKPLADDFQESQPSHREVRFAVDRRLPLVYERSHPRDPHRSERISVYPLKENMSILGSAIIRISDVTEARLLQREVIQNEKLASLGLLVSTVAHEMNNPNSFISLNIPILRDYLDEILPILDDYASTRPDYEIFGMSYPEFRQDVLKLLQNIEHGASRISTVISNLREFSGAQRDRPMEWVALREVVEKAAAICAGELKNKVRSFEIEGSHEPLRIYTDPEALEQVVVNLLINAIQALDKEESWIKITIAPDPSRADRLSIGVSDNGCGINPTLRDRIFEPFFTTKPAGTGTGLGLYVCRNLVDQLGGEVTVESEPGQGSTFKITLPGWRKDPTLPV